MHLVSMLVGGAIAIVGKLVHEKKFKATARSRLRLERDVLSVG